MEPTDGMLENPNVDITISSFESCCGEYKPAVNLSKSS